MKLTTHPHKSDLLTMTREELNELLAGKELSVSALYIRMEEEPKPNVVTFDCVQVEHEEAMFAIGDNNLKLTWCGETGKLKSAEVL